MSIMQYLLKNSLFLLKISIKLIPLFTESKHDGVGTQRNESHFISHPNKKNSCLFSLTLPDLNYA